MRTNRPAFGARIEVTVKSGEALRHIYRTVGYASSFGGNPLRQHIGLGRASRVSRVEVTWPTSQQVQKFSDVAVDAAYHLREGSPTLTPVQYKRFLFPHPAQTNAHGEAAHH